MQDWQNSQSRCHIFPPRRLVEKQALLHPSRYPEGWLPIPISKGATCSMACLINSRSSENVFLTVQYSKVPPSLQGDWTNHDPCRDMVWNEPSVTVPLGSRYVAKPLQLQPGPGHPRRSPPAAAPARRGVGSNPGAAPLATGRPAHHLLVGDHGEAW